MAIKQIISYYHKPASFYSLASLYSLIEWMPVFKNSIATVFIGSVLTFYLLGRGTYQLTQFRWSPPFPGRRGEGAIGYILIISVLLQLSFYTFYLPAFWVLTRYYYFIYAVVLISFALVLASPQTAPSKVIAPYFLALVVVIFCGYLLPFFGKPEKTMPAEIGGLKGYREVALAVRSHLSPGDVVGALQSGALSYYAPPSVRVINLDGVVSGPAAEAFKNKTMKDYVDSQHMNRFADWEYNAFLFKILYGGSFPGACFNTIYQAEKQGSQWYALREYKPKCS